MSRLPLLRQRRGDGAFSGLLPVRSADSISVCSMYIGAVSLPPCSRFDHVLLEAPHIDEPALPTIFSFCRIKIKCLGPGN